MTDNNRDDLARALLDLDAARTPTPCQRPFAWRRFLSDDRDTRAAAALECPGCPILDLCADAGQSERFGVWGGRDRSPDGRKAHR